MEWELGVEIPEEVGRKALSADRHFLQSRYVNTFYSDALVDYYTFEDTEKLVRYHREKVQSLERYLLELRRELDLKLVILFGPLARGD